MKSQLIITIALITLAYPQCTVCTPVPYVDDVIECKVEDDCPDHYTCLTPPGYCTTCAAWGHDDEDTPAKCKVTVSDNTDTGDVQFGECQVETDCELGFWCFERKCHDCQDLETSDSEAYQDECAEWIQHLEKLIDTSKHQNSTEHTTEGDGEEPQTDTNDETLLGWTVGLSISTFLLLIGFVIYCYRKKFKRWWCQRAQMNCWQKNVNRNGQPQQFQLVNEGDNAGPVQEPIFAEEDGEREHEDTLLPPENREPTVAAIQPVDDGQTQSKFLPDQPEMMA